MTSRQKGILEELRATEFVPSAVLAAAVGAPVAAVRRNIAALRAKGFDIVSTSRGYRYNGIWGNSEVGDELSGV